MKRLDILKAEKEKIKEMRCLSFSLIDKCIEWYDREIEAIEVHGAANDDYKDVAQADGDLISKSKLIMYLNDWRFGVAPDETTNPNVRYKRKVTVDVIDEFMKIVEQLPSVAIPSAEPKWIPVSERSPKAGEYVGDVDKYYLVQNEYGDMLVARYTHSEYWEQMYQLKPISDEIVAWMPLPEPYREEGEEE